MNTKHAYARITRPAGPAILLSVHDVASVTKNPDGSANIVYKKLKTIEGVKPLVLDYEQVIKAVAAYRSSPR